MSWKAVQLLSESHDAEGNIKREYKAIADPGTGENAETALFASGPTFEGSTDIATIPQRGQYYSSSTGRESAAVVTTIEASRDGQNEDVYSISIGYSDSTDNKDNENDERDKMPWQKSPVLSINGDILSVSSFVDINGALITNSAGNVAQVPPSINFPVPSITYSKAKKLKDNEMMDRIVNFSGRINSEAYDLLGKTFPIYTLLVTITGQKSYISTADGGYVSYWDETINFVYNPKGHRGTFLDEGFYGEWTFPDGTERYGRFNEYLGYFSGTHKFSQNKKSDTPFHLNGAGKILSLGPNTVNAPDFSDPRVVPAPDSNSLGVQLYYDNYGLSNFDGLI